MAHLREYGTISNQTVQNLLLVGGQRASVVLRSLAERAVIQRTADSPTRGPSVRYQPGPAFPARNGRADRAGGVPVTDVGPRARPALKCVPASAEEVAGRVGPLGPAARHAAHADERAEARDEHGSIGRDAKPPQLDHVAHFVDVDRKHAAERKPPAIQPPVHAHPCEHRARAGRAVDRESVDAGR